MEDTTADRRTVLKTAGAAIGASLGVASTPASAQVGTCVYLTDSADVWETCPPSGYLGTAPFPAQGRILADCYRFGHVYVEWDKSYIPDGYVDQSLLAEC